MGLNWLLWNMISPVAAGTKKVKILPFKEAIWPTEYFVKTNRSWLYSIGNLIVGYVTGVSIVVLLFFFVFGIYSLLAHNDAFIKSPYLLLADVLSQFAIIFFSLDFILSTRIRFIEDLFGGMDRVYKTHNILGRLGFYLLTLHFLFILIDTQTLDWSVLSLYLLPSTYWPYTFGILGFWGFIFLILLTIWIKIPYHLWLLTHKFMGVPFVLGGIHAWLTVPDYAQFQPYRTTLIIIWGLGAIAYVYKTLLYKYLGPVYTGRIQSVYVNQNIYDIFIQVANKFHPKPGQFVSLSIANSQNKLKKEFHPFSISGVYKNNVVRLSVKSNGDFTQTLSKLAVGDEIKLQGPYGRFGDKLFTSSRDMVWVAGGIGVAPFLFLAEYLSLI
jgi:predicted ferric reductase